MKTTIRNKKFQSAKAVLNMSKQGVSFTAIVAILLVACGEDDTTSKLTRVMQDNVESVAEVDELPPCTIDNDGELIFVKGEATMRVCSDSKWYATIQSLSTSCATEGLADNSGVKIICNGDSVGVVLNEGNGINGLNGADGKDGINGVNGIDGKDGIDGINGKNGENGVDGKDGKDGASCTVETLKDNSGLKVLCGGDSVGVVLNGTNGANGLNGAQGIQGVQGEKGDKGDTGAQGIQGEKGDKGDSGTGCYMEKEENVQVRVICGADTAIVWEVEVPEEVQIDSEKVAVSLDEVSGVTQKGPFLSGSKVLVREMSDGRTLTQTGNSFNGKILNDKGEFKINARMLVSQYVMLEATGYYRNEVTGGNSNSELTLFAITDVNDRNVVNVNLLTHLEYERVVYLVTQKKMKVKAAKKQAQKEVFGLLDIDATDFSNSEDLNIAGSSDEDGALLAFSLLFQGDRTVAQLTELLTKIATDMEKDGSWDDATTKMNIAEWAADADSSGRLNTIRNNVKAWGLSSMVPDFEQHVRHFWNAEYGLGDCSADSVEVVKAATAGKRKGTKTRYICKETDAVSGDYRWVIASDFEKDIYGWKAGSDGEVKVGSVTGTKYYLFDKTTEKWRDASIVEQVKGGCIESVAADPKKNTGFVNGYWYKCENRSWVRTTAYIVDTQGWVSGSDGDAL